MNCTDIVSIIGLIIVTIGFLAGAAIYWLDLKLKPIIIRLTEIEKKQTDIDKTLSIIVDGLLDNGQIPKK